MPQYKVEYRESRESEVLKFDLFSASDDAEAVAETKRNFTAVQANLGARHFQVLDHDAVVVAAHQSSPDP